MSDTGPKTERVDAYVGFDKDGRWMVIGACDATMEDEDFTIEEHLADEGFGFSITHIVADVSRWVVPTVTAEAGGDEG